MTARRVRKVKKVKRGHIWTVCVRVENSLFPKNSREREPKRRAVEGKRAISVEHVVGVAFYFAHPDSS